MIRNRLEWSTGLHPSSKPTINNLGLAVPLVHHISNSDAGGLANTGTVKIYLTLGSHEFTQSNQLFFEPVWLDPYRILNSLHTRVVIPVATHIRNDDQTIRIGRLKSLL